MGAGPRAARSHALMKAVVMEKYGTPDVLELRDVAKPTPKAGEVLVRVHVASINDRVRREGKSHRTAEEWKHDHIPRMGGA